MNSKRSKRFPTYDIFVGNIPSDATEREVAKLFTCFGETNYVSVREGNRNDGTKIAFIRYLNEPDAELAISERSGHMWDGMQLIVQRAQKKTETKSDESFGTISLAQVNNNNKKAFFKDNSQAGDSRPLPTEKVLVTHVEDSCTFWAQSAQDNTRNADLMDTLFEVCGCAQQVTGKPNLHQIYATVYSLDDNWYRCVVLQHITDGKSLVKYIDYGNAEIIDNYKVVCLPEEISCVPGLAQRYRLNGLFLKRDNPSLLHEGNEYLKNQISDKVVEVKKYKMDKYLSYIDVSVDGVSLGQEILKLGYAVSTCQAAPKMDALGFVRLDQMNKSGIERDAYSFSKDGKMPHPIRGRSVLRTDSPDVKEQEYHNMDHPFLQHDNRAGWGNAPYSPARHQQQHLNQQNPTNHLAAVEERHKREIKILQSHLLTCKQKLDEATSKRDFLSYIGSLSDEVTKVRKFRQHFNTVDQNDWLEEAALILLDEKSRVLPQNLLHLPAVKQAMNHYQSCQNMIKGNFHKEKVDVLVTERNELRRALHSTLVAFLMEIKTLPLESRCQTLNDCLEKLKSNYSLYLTRESPGPVPLKNVLEAYKEWKATCFPEIKAYQIQTDTHLGIFQFKFNQLLQALTLDVQSSNETPTTADIIECTQHLNMALRNEIEKCSQEEKQGFKVMALMAAQVFNELTQECDYVKQVRHSEREYTTLEGALHPWLSDKPNLERLNEINKSIRTLRSKLRHKLADQKDLEEENVEEELEMVKKEISEIRVKLQKEFSEQDKFLTECVPVVKEHFPEFMCQYPEFQTEMQYDGLVKQNRELDHFDLHVISSSLWKTNSCGTLHVIKECHMEPKPKMDELLRRLSNYSKINCRYLSPIISLFFSKTGREVYVQMPFYTHSLIDRTGSVNEILIAVLEALKELHGNNLIHGKLTPKCVKLTEEDNFVLIPNIFSATKQMEETLFRGLSFTAPEIREGSGVESPSSDMYSFGCLMLWLLYPETNFSMNELGLPELSQLPSSMTLNLISNLVTNVSRTRPAAYSLLQSDIFARLNVLQQHSCALEESIMNASGVRDAHRVAANTHDITTTTDQNSTCQDSSQQGFETFVGDMCMSETYHLPADETAKTVCIPENKQESGEEVPDNADGYYYVEQMQNAYIPEFYTKSSTESTGSINMCEYYPQTSGVDNLCTVGCDSEACAELTYIPEYTAQSAAEQQEEACTSVHQEEPTQTVDNSDVAETYDETGNENEKRDRSMNENEKCSLMQNY